MNNYQKEEKEWRLNLMGSVYLPTGTFAYISTLFIFVFGQVLGPIIRIQLNSDNHLFGTTLFLPFTSFPVCLSDQIQLLP